jgi:hypothetical protein
MVASIKEEIMLRDRLELEVDEDLLENNQHQQEHDQREQVNEFYNDVETNSSEMDSNTDDEYTP